MILLLVLALSSGLNAAAPDGKDMQPVMVRPGDTLWGIANKYLKDPARWDEILKHNRLPSSDPTVALPGMTLRVPIKLIKEDLRAARLIYRQNRVLFRRKETADWKTAGDSMELFRNDSLRTLEDSKAKVKFSNEDMLQLDPNSMAIIKPVGRDYDVELKQGGVFVGKAKVVTVSAKITPKTPDTKYAATVGNDLSTVVQVYTGKAGVEAEGQSVEVLAGMATQVKMGLAPELPVRIADLPDFEARAAEFAGDFGVVRAKVISPGLKPPNANVVDVNLAPEVGSIRTEVEAQRIGEPISGYRLQFSRSEDFSKPIFEKIFEADEAVKVSAITLPKGHYWGRIALIDLLGTEGRFSEPKLYSLSAAGLTLFRDLKSKITLIRPIGDQVVLEPQFRVQGRAREKVRVLVNGAPVRFDDEGNFSVLLPLVKGTNEIRVNIIDDDGNTDYILRTVTYTPPEDGG